MTRESVRTAVVDLAGRLGLRMRAPLDGRTATTFGHGEMREPAW
jgi:hypothetical protein